MKNVFLKSSWAAAVLVIAVCAVTRVHADNEPRSKNKGGGSNARSNNNSSGRRNNNDGGQQSGATGGTTINKAGPGVLAPGGINNSGPAKLVPGSGNAGTGRASGGNNKASSGNNKKVPDKSAWNKATKDGWHKDGWNNNFNSQHQLHRHGYWNNGIWIAPWFIASNQRWIYLQPAQPIVSGQKWLGVTYEPYDGGGAYVNGIYQGSPAQQVGLEVGDVIVSLDGVDATQLGSVIQASNGNVVLQVLSGRTGALVETPVNLIR